MRTLILSLLLCYSLNSLAQDDKVTLCAACHGPQGISTTIQWPNLAGQHPKYLSKQLKDMQTGQRSVPTMQGIVASLQEQDIKELADYYAKIPAAQGSTPQKYLKRGEQLYRGGDFNKRISACIACHGPKGTGNAQAGFPLIAGQHAAYTMQQLFAFKNGSRSNDLNHIMHDISKKMNKEDMEAVAHYIEGLY